MLRSEFLQQSDKLGEYARNMPTLRLGVAHLKEDIAAREVFMIPPEGWPGKNESERKAAAAKAYAEDPALREMRAALRTAEIAVAQCEGEMDAIKQRMTALQMLVRDQTAQALGAAGVFDEAEPLAERAAADEAERAEEDGSDAWADPGEEEYTSVEIPF